VVVVAVRAWTGAAIAVVSELAEGVIVIDQASQVFYAFCARFALETGDYDRIDAGNKRQSA
jgi:hypothetical protein